MLKCASKCLIATFQKGLLRGNAELSKKAVETRKRNSVLKLTPCLVVRFTRYYGFCTGNSGKFSNEKKQGKGPKEKKNSILDDFKNNVFDALRWVGKS